MINISNFNLPFNRMKSDNRGSSLTSEGKTEKGVGRTTPEVEWFSYSLFRSSGLTFRQWVCGK